MDEKILARYDSKEGADSYLGKFQRHLGERVNDWHEQRLVRSLLADVPRGGVVLDMPCGYGRLRPLAASRGDRVVLGDWGFEMLRNARRTLQERGALAAGERPPLYVRGNALQMPFRDAAFDGVLSVRLCHHIREPIERARYVDELFRIARRWVVFTYFDARSLKARIRVLRSRLTGQRAKWTMDADEVSAIAARRGFDVARSVPLSRLFSGHRYVVAVRREAPVAP